MSQLTAFNSQLINFIHYLDTKFPDNLQIKSYETSLELLKKVNPRKLVEGFYEFVYPFKQEIMESNESFFMNKDYNEDMGGNSDSMLEAIQLKEIWNTAPEDVRSQIFRYFQLLCLLMEKCIQVPTTEQTSSE